MDNLFDVIDKMIYDANIKMPIAEESIIVEECIRLVESGWRVVDYKSDSEANNIVARFQDSNGTTKDIILRFSDQIMWMQYLERREELVKNVRNI